ncbi:hypothetical protein N0V83_004314 [Neocucurbitaria cava]|uniref:Uncharacterized protein n=1 Tax=Neocucurbitaria cava TaxID=798079 RepID=A0A9W9CMD9_9PLEO|nr:hypothetical protein N0V83_004314 [Neocucurbitaria cava]
MARSTTLPKTKKRSEAAKDVVDADAADATRTSSTDRNYSNWTNNKLKRAIIRRRTRDEDIPPTKRDQWIALLEHLDLRDDEIRASNTSQVDDKPVDVAATNAKDGNPVVIATGDPQKRKRASGDETGLQKRRKTVAQQLFQVPQPISLITAQHEQLDKTDTELQKPTQVQHVPAFLERTEDSPSNPLPRDQIEEPEAPNYNEDVQMTDVGVTIPAHAEEPGEDVGIQVVSHTAHQTASGMTPDMPSAAPNKLDKQAIKEARRPSVKKAGKSSKAPKPKMDTEAVQKKNIAPKQIREATAAMDTVPDTNEAVESLKELEHQLGIVDTEHVEISDERPRGGVVKPPSPKRSRRLAKTTETHSKAQNTTGNGRTAKKPLFVSSMVGPGLPSFLDTSVSYTQTAEVDVEVLAARAVAAGESQSRVSAKDLEVTSAEASNKGNSRAPTKKRFVTGNYMYVPSEKEDKKARPGLMNPREWQKWKERMREYDRRDAEAAGDVYAPPKDPKPWDWRDAYPAA